MPRRPRTLHEQHDQPAHNWAHKTNRHERGYDSHWYAIAAHHKRTHPLCAACQRLGRVSPVAVTDHIVAQAFGGLTRADNLQSLCSDCNTRKTALESQLARKRRLTLDEQDAALFAVSSSGLHAIGNRWIVVRAAPRRIQEG